MIYKKGDLVLLGQENKQMVITNYDSKKPKNKYVGIPVTGHTEYVFSPDDINCKVGSVNNDHPVFKAPEPIKIKLGNPAMMEYIESLQEGDTVEIIHAGKKRTASWIRYDARKRKYPIIVRPFHCTRIYKYPMNCLVGVENTNV